MDPHLRKRLLPAYVVIASLAVFGGCANNQTAAYLTARHLVGIDPKPDALPLNAQYRYLRVSIGSTTALMVLGEVDHDGSPYPIEVWYSADRRVLKLQNGRIVGMLGLPTEWRHVSFTPAQPEWPVSESKRKIAYRRIVDRMPLYDIGRVETVNLRRIAPPTDSGLQRLNPQDMVWFEETVDSNKPSRFAFSTGNGDKLQPIYGEQCISRDLCLQWQHWR